jgi:hypothetical protein
MMRRRLLLAAAAGCALVASVTASSDARGYRVAAVTATLSPDSISGVTGNTNVITMALDLGTSGKLLGSYTVRLTWDSSVVRVDSVRSGSFGLPLVNYVGGGEVRLTQVNALGLGGSVTLAQLFVRFVNDTAGKRTVIQPTFTEITALDFTNLLADFSATGTVARVLAPRVFVRFSPDSTYERVGFTPQIDLTAQVAQSGVALGSYAAQFTWDSTVMRLDSIKPADYAAPQTNQINAGELRLTSADASGRTGLFSLARLYFTFLDESFPRLTPLTLTVSEAHAAISFADLLPGVTAISGKAVIGGVLRGDIDVSGALAALDAQLILQSVVGLNPPGTRPVPHGDADCGGALQARDAQIVLNQVVGNSVAQFCAGTIQ